MEKISVALEKCRMMPVGQTTDAWDVLTVQNLIYEPLVRGKNGQIFPALAKSWIVLDHGTRWLFFLRENASFSDGSPCTSEDVIRSIEDMRNARDSFGMPGPFSRYLFGVQLRTIDSQTVEVKTTTANGDIADFLNEIFIRKQSYSSTALLGTGVYELEDFIPEKLISLRKRADQQYSSAVVGKLDFLITPDRNRRWELLKSGQVSIAMDLDQLDKVPFEDSSVNWYKTINTLSVMGFLNCFTSPFNSCEARMALNLAVNVDELIKEVVHGLAVPSKTIVSPFHCGFESELQTIPYDPDRAKALFSKAIMPEKLILRSPTYMPERAAESAAFIVRALENIGLKVELDIVEDRPEYARQVGRKETGHIALFDSSPHSSYRVLTDKISSVQKGLWWQGFADPDLDSMISTAHQVVGTKEREFAYARALSYLNKNPSWLYLYHPILVAASSKNIKNIEITNEGLLHFAGTW